jgi:hypothetical protein
MIKQAGTNFGQTNDSTHNFGRDYLVLHINFIVISTSV